RPKAPHRTSASSNPWQGIIFAAACQVTFLTLLERSSSPTVARRVGVAQDNQCGRSMVAAEAGFVVPLGYPIGSGRRLASGNCGIEEPENLSDPPVVNLPQRSDHASPTSQQESAPEAC